MTQQPIDVIRAEIRIDRTAEPDEFRERLEAEAQGLIAEAMGLHAALREIDELLE